MVTTSRNRSWALPAALALAAAAGCRTDGYVRGEETASQMYELRASANACKRQITLTLGSLDALLEGIGGEGRDRFEKFRRDVTLAESQMADVESRFEDVRADARDYFNAWYEQIPEIQNPDLQKRSEARRLALMATMQRLLVAMADARPVLDPYLAAMRDARLYLSQDLSAEGLQSLRDVAQRLMAEEPEVHRRLDGVVAAIDDVAPRYRAEPTPKTSAR